MSEVVLDSSALLALLNTEPGADAVSEALANAVIGAVNLSEVIAKLSKKGMPENEVRHILDTLGLDIIPFEREQAYAAGLLLKSTEWAGLSFGDRACLSLGKMLNAEIITADRSWAGLPIGAKIKVIR